MYIPSTYLAIAYFLTYLPIWETYFLQYWLPRWNQILTQLRFIHNWVMTGIQWMVHWRGRWFNVATLYTCNSPGVGCLKLSWEIVRWTYKNPNKLLYYIVCVCVCWSKQGNPHCKEEEQGVCHNVALPFLLQSIVRQKKNYGNSNISLCNNIIFEKPL